MSEALQQMMDSIAPLSDCEMERLWKKGRPLTNANLAVISGLARGLSVKEIAVELGRSVSTIRNQIKDAMMRADVRSVTGLISYALFGRILSKEEFDAIFAVKIPMSKTSDILVRAGIPKREVIDRLMRLYPTTKGSAAYTYERALRKLRGICV